MRMRDACLEFFLRSKPLMDDREWLLDCFSVVDRMKHELPEDKTQQVKLDTTLVFDRQLFTDPQELDRVRFNGATGYIAKLDESSVHVTMLCQKTQAIFSRTDTFYLQSGMIENYVEAEVALLTTAGLFLLNQVCLAYVFQNRFPYLNGRWKADKLADLMAHAMQTKLITASEFGIFVDEFVFLTHITELWCASLTERTLMSDPKNEEIKRKFMAEHADTMDDPMVQKELEDILQKNDREYVGNDPSERFYNGLGSKSWDIHRKKMFLTVGGIEKFDIGVGGYDFIANSLDEGWTYDAFPAICNEIRKGSYSRGKETAKGGAETKLLTRIFQDVTISEDDCHSLAGIIVDFSIFPIEKFIGRYLIMDTGASVMITDENKANYAGKRYLMRSPQGCKITSPHFCFTCFGDKYRNLDATRVGSSPTKLSSTYMNAAMKNMHGTSIKTFNVDLRKFMVFNQNAVFPAETDVDEPEG